MINLFSNKTSLKRFLIMLAAVFLLFAMTTVVFAVVINIDVVVGQILNLVLNVIQYIGIILLIYGAVLLVLAMRNEDADSKTRSTLFLVSSVILIALKTAVKEILTTLNFPQDLTGQLK